MKLKTKPILISSLLLISFSAAHGQCKRFAKRNCLPDLKPYVSNGQMNATNMSPGDQADVWFTFNKGISYRMVICADQYLGEVIYQLTDEAGNLFKTDTLKEANRGIIDLNVKKPTSLKLEVKAPEKENATGIIGSGCVSILLGFKY